MSNTNAPFIGISRHRLLRDGRGVTTLAAFHGCPLDCLYCLNPTSKVKQEDCNTLVWHTPESLYEKVKKDDIYFRATGGGVCFGGGEPLLHNEFINVFHDICPDDWCLTLETSLNVPHENIVDIAEVIDGWIIDIKDMNPCIYQSYTKRSNTRVLENLKWLMANGYGKRISVRVPLIPNFNTPEDCEQSALQLQELGILRIEKFKYRLPSEITESHKRREFPSKRPYGKDTCAVLKAIRQLIADKNNITYSPHICTHEGPCLGTCPACEAEVRFIEKELYTRKAKGEVITI